MSLCGVRLCVFLHPYLYYFMVSQVFVSGTFSFISRNGEWIILSVFYSDARTCHGFFTIWIFGHVETLLETFSVQ